MRRCFYIFGFVLVSLALTGCALTTGFRFGDDGSVGKPEVHGSIGTSGTIAGH